LRVKVVGNYGADNAGDRLYLKILKERFPNHDFSGIDNEYLIYGGGSILGTRKAGVKPPFCVLSVGYREKTGDDFSFVRGADFVTVRDPIALVECRKHNKNTRLLPDLGFLHKVKPSLRGEGVAFVLRKNAWYDVETILNHASRLAIDSNTFVHVFNTYGQNIASGHNLDKQFCEILKHENVPFENHGVWDKTWGYFDFLNDVHTVYGMTYHSIVLGRLYGCDARVILPYDIKMGMIDVIDVEKAQKQAETHIELLKERIG
jgi:hypothetical protein